MQYINILKQHDPSMKKEFKNKLLFENIFRLKVVALVGSLVNAMIVFIFMKQADFHGEMSTDSIVRLFWIAASLAYVLLIGHPRSREQLNIRHRIIFFGAAALSLMFSGILTGVSTAHSGYTFVYIINCMITGSFFYLSFYEMVFIVTPTISYYIFTMVTVANTALNNQSNAVNIFAVTVFSIMICVMSYRSQLQLFDSQNTICDQNILLKELSELDGLTHIPNRRKFDEVYSIEWAHACREKKPLSLIMADIDFFKNYNDHYGHLAGDDCLKQVAELLGKSLLRQTDIFCRYGGEEFIAILPDTDQAGAIYVAEHIRQNLAKASIPHEKSSFKQVTLSIGIATLEGFDYYTKDKLIEAADKAMYLVKQTGRNQIEAEIV
jgi:diguanylate cyclase (GGDEF)-like protein